MTEPKNEDRKDSQGSYYIVQIRGNYDLDKDRDMKKPKSSTGFADRLNRGV